LPGAREAAGNVISKPKTMTKIVPLLFSMSACCLLASCDTATPQTYFEVAVLNCNLMHGFAGNGLERELESPSVKLSDAGNGATVPMKRKEIIDSKIQSLETYLERVKSLKQTDDTREMLEASVALYEYVLPVYKNEYQELARLYDEGALRERIDSLVSSIETKYHGGFATRFDGLTAAGKPYAERHHINVKWDISTEPSS
jgi:hypothetical protein